ncbi:MAG: prolyl oligopeptidase family serine peptidase [Thermomicrobiales bacterium]
MASDSGTSSTPHESRPTFDQFTAIRRYQGALAFSPDGSEIAYSVNTSGQFNLWRQSSDGGFPHQVTLSGAQAVRDIAWSPDGSALLYTADNDGDEFTKIYQAPPQGGQPVPIATTPQVQFFVQGWSPDGRFIAYAGNDREPTDQDVILRNVETGELQRPMAPGGLLYPMFWSPNSTKLLVVDGHSNTDSDLHLLEVAAGTSQLLTEHEGEVSFLPVGWAADGSGFYVLSNEDREFNGLAFHRLDDGSRQWIETPDWDVEDAAVSADGRWLVWSVNEDGYSRIFARDLTADQAPVTIDLPEGVLGTMALSRPGNRLAVLWQQPIHPAEIFIVDLATGNVNQITDSFLGGIDERDLTRPELIHFKTFDGREIPAYLYRPDAAGATKNGKLPVVLSIHGGPEAQERPQYMYAGLYQYLASRGIAVLAPNIRGSTGYGKTYQTLIHHDWGGNELKDLEAAAQYLQGCDWVDSGRIGVYGGSFGGFATLSCVSRLPDYWAVAVDLVGPSNLVTFAKAVPPTWRRMMAQWVGDPETEVDFLMSRSPVTYVDQIAAPLFVIQGANDPRVVKPESDQIVEQLRERGVDVRYDVYEDEGHGFTKRENEIKAFGDIATFLEQHLTRTGR